MRRLTGTSPKTDASFSKTETGSWKFNVDLPKSWQELTQQQLHYVYLLLSLGTPMSELKVWCFVRFSGLNVAARGEEGWIFAYHVRLGKTEYFQLSEEVINWAVQELDFLDSYPDTPAVVKHFGEYYAVDPLLHDITFGEYLALENMYQGYLATKEQLPLINMTRTLYRNIHGERPKKVNNVQCLAVAVWYASFKTFCTDHWPHLFRKTSEDEEQEPIDMEERMNAQIRALTGGDATKEHEVLELNLWRALTEMDAKARDAEEQKRELDKLKNK